MQYLTTLLTTFLILMGAIVATGSNTLIRNLRDEPYDSVRMSNVRLLPADIRIGVVRDYVKQMPDSADVLILGDSQTYGNNLPPKESLGEYLRTDKGSRVFNMSIVDGRSSDQRKIINICKEERKHFKYIVMNINPSHFKKGMIDPQHIPDKHGSYSLIFSLFATSDLGIYAPFFKIPYIEIPLINNQLKNVYGLDMYDSKQEYRKTSFSFDERPVSKEYYSQLDASAPYEMLAALKAASGISEKVIAFAAPTSYEIYNSPPIQLGL